MRAGADIGGSRKPVCIWSMVDVLCLSLSSIAVGVRRDRGPKLSMLVDVDRIELRKRGGESALGLGQKCQQAGVSGSR
jgi:hypothetical protein